MSPTAGRLDGVTWRWGWLVLASACGRVDFDARIDASIGVEIDAAAPDAAALCASSQGPSMVDIGGATPFCIDSTEVTRAQYQAFLASAPPITGQPAGCEINDGFTPQAQWPPGQADQMFPVVGVDWCDAHAFCAWAGKRLCGAVGGGSATFATADTVSAQWFSACTMAGTRNYPYGASYIAGECSDGAAVTAVASFATCQSYPGVYDMSGNAHEWIDACTTGAECLLIGGGIGGHPGGDMRCDTTIAMTRTIQGDDGGQSWVRETGFRCCR